jgi:hypothetical protein
MQLRQRVGGAGDSRADDLEARLVILAVLQGPSGRLPLFVHLLGAVATFGGVGTAAAVGWVARQRPPEQALLLRRVAWRTLLYVVIPGFIALRGGAQWIQDKEFPGDAPGWTDVGFIVTEIGGVLVLLPLLVTGFLAARRPTVNRLALAVPALASLYLAALAVAVWAMTAKPGS